MNRFQRIELAKQAQAFQKTLGEKLQVHMIELLYGDQADLVGDPGERIWACSCYIKSEPEEVLTFWVTANQGVLNLVTEPTGEIEARIENLESARAGQQVLIDRAKRA